MSPSVRAVGSGLCSSSRSCRRGWDPASPLAERGAHEIPRLALDSLGLLSHARTVSLPALTASPRPAAPVHHGPARSSTWPPPPTFARLAPAHRAPPAHLDPSFPIARGRDHRRRAASFNAPFSRIALSRDDTKKPSSFSVMARLARGSSLWTCLVTETRVSVMTTCSPNSSVSYSPFCSEKNDGTKTRRDDRDAIAGSATLPHCLAIRPRHG